MCYSFFRRFGFGAASCTGSEAGASLLAFFAPVFRVGLGVAGVGSALASVAGGSASSAGLAPFLRRACFAAAGVTSAGVDSA